MISTKKKALQIANKYGMTLDECNTGRLGPASCVIFDHPTRSFDGDCRSITVSGYCSMAVLWKEAIDRMEAECPHLVLCEDPNCDYHQG